MTGMSPAKVPWQQYAVPPLTPQVGIVERSESSAGTARAPKMAENSGTRYLKCILSEVLQYVAVDFGTMISSKQLEPYPKAFPGAYPLLSYYTRSLNAEGLLVICNRSMVRKSLPYGTFLPLRLGHSTNTDVWTSAFS
jgi:hypothetical protein